MSINLRLTIEAMTENIRKQSERREKLKKELLKLCPFKIDERVKLTNKNTGAERFAFVKGFYVNDSGIFIYSLYHYKVRSYGNIKQSTQRDFNEILGKCEQLKSINHEHTKQRFNSAN